MPALAHQKSTAGAKAFVRYYIDVLNFAHIIASGELLAHISSSDCEVCRYLGENIDEMERQGGGQKGGAWTARSIKLLPAGSAEQRNLSVTILVNRGTSQKTSDSPLEPIKRRIVFDDFYLEWRGARWQLTNLVPW
jgi:hypothetical protein